MSCSDLKSQRPLRIAIIASTGGSVYRETCLRSEWLRTRIQIMISDRACGAVDAANTLGHKVILHRYDSAQAFSERVHEELERHRIDLAISFYTRRFEEPLLSTYQGRLFNFHPSLLPACPGLHGFEDTIASGARLLGSTVHLVDANIDAGLPILQSHFYRAPKETLPETRHRLFIQQCKSLLQVIRWQEAARIRPSSEFVEVIGSELGDGEFSPALDAEDALTLSIPYIASC